MRAPAAVLIIALQAAVLAGAASDLPLNQWVKLDTPREAGYTYSQPVYVPSRGAVLHWGAVAGGDYRAWMRNDVRAFDAQALRWRPDYPVAEKLPGLKTGSSAGKGLSYVGHGEMLACGTPAPSMIANGVCYDSTRDQVVVTMKGLMAAYDPKARKWRHVEAKTVLYGQEVPGGPPVYGVGTAYDPVNDQIVLFPQWGGKNVDRRELTGEVSAHLGTFRYSFEDDTWRRVGHTFGSDTVRAARQRTLALMGELSTLLDGAWRLRRQPRPAEAKVLGEKLAALRDRAAGAAGQMPKGAGRAIGQALGPLAAAAASAATGRPSAALSRGSEALRRLDAVLDGPLRVQPPPRCGTPLVTHPEAKVIVMFGGHSGLVRTDLEDARHHGGAPGALNDTWLYDLATRQWHELPCPRRPLPTLWPKMVYDPASRLVLLVTRTGPWANKKERVITLWGLDVTEGRWSKLHQQPWTWDYGAGHATGWRPDPFEVALDRDDGLLLLTQNVRQDRTPVEQVFAFRLDIVGGTSLSRENKDAGRRRPA
ncbi:MAG: kelch repeat-containing protein, partial [Candidatus Brocadiia bacterium]